MTNQLLDACKSFLKTQILHSEEKIGKPEPEKPKPFVTISRQTGAGGITVGKLLVDYLREHDKNAPCPWTVFDKNMVDYVLEEHKLPKEFGKYMTEAKVSETRDIMETLFELHPPTFALVRDTSETILHLAQLGHTVIVGRGGNIVTKKLEGGLRVRLIAPPEKRIEHVRSYYEMSEKDAAELIKNEMKGRKDYLKQNFGKNIDDAELYDLVINTERISYLSAAEMIGRALLERHKQF